MNDEIKVGSYIRTNDGYIAKVIKKDKDGWYHCDSTVEECYEDDFKFFKKGELDIAKHSPNIIDLIEENDYVNGYIVKEINCVLCNFDLNNMEWTPLEEIDVIENILTKEQFEKIMYRVEE